MQFKQLEALVNVINFGSFSKAASAGFLSQPTISAHIHGLEKAVGQKLLLRSTKEVQATAAGRKLYQYAVEILKIRDIAMQEMSDSEWEPSGLLRIAATASLSSYALTPQLSRLTAHYPKLSYRIVSASASQAVDLILQAEVDIALTDEKPNDISLLAEPLGPDPLALIFPPEGAWSNAEFETVHKAPYLTCESEPALHKQGLAALVSTGIERGMLKFQGSWPTVSDLIRAVAEGLGVALVPLRSIPNPSPVQVLELPQASCDRELYLLQRKGENLTPAAAILLKIFCELNEAQSTDPI